MGSIKSMNSEKIFFFVLFNLISTQKSPGELIGSFVATGCGLLKKIKFGVNEKKVLNLLVHKVRIKQKHHLN